MTNTLLEQLRDIHQPAAISWWPLAPGWYAVLVLFLIGLIYITRYFLGKYHLRRVALHELALLKKAFLQGENSAYIASELSILLRKVLLVKCKKEDVSGLTGDAWLQFLDKKNHTDQFTQGSGRMLLSAPYALQVNDNIEPLFNLIELTIKRSI